LGIFLNPGLLNLCAVLCGILKIMLSSLLRHRLCHKETKIAAFTGKPCSAPVHSKILLECLKNNMGKKEKNYDMVSNQ